MDRENVGCSEVIVWRVEGGPYNDGPYCAANTDWLELTGEIPASSGQWPSDGNAFARLAQRLRITRWERLWTIVYGFKNYGEYTAWFTPRHREALAQVGLRLVRYRVPVEAVEEGIRQVVFDRAQATKLDSHRPTADVTAFCTFINP